MARGVRVWLKRGLWAGLAATGLFAAVAIVDGWAAFGTSPTGAALARVEASPQFHDGVFVNPQPLYNDFVGSITGLLGAPEFTAPADPVPVVATDPTQFATPPAEGLRVTWLGHSTVLIEIDGALILTDPVFGPRSSPLTWLGPKRWYPPPLALTDVPPVDAVVLSHDHYDHLDYPSIVAMKEWKTTFIAPLGVGAHLRYWGVPAERVLEVDWWDETVVSTAAGGELRVVATPARHASGRHLFDQDETLWAGFALIGDTHRVFFSGDTGLFPAMREIGTRWGPFDVAMVEVGAYDQNWPDWHIGPEQAITAHQWLRGRLFIPIHWGLFDLAAHNWTEPIERVTRAADGAGVEIQTPLPGQSVVPGVTAAIEPWWPAVAWRTAEEYPIRSTRID
ncbi:MAG: MBL fold metallo-hydrolase [Myxococcota bacterium]